MFTLHASARHKHSAGAQPSTAALSAERPTRSYLARFGAMLVVALVAAMTLVAAPAPAHAAAGDSFNLDRPEVFVVAGTPSQLYRIERTPTGNGTLVPEGPPATFVYNALSFNPSDGYLYALATTNGTTTDGDPAPIGSLLRIGQEGHVSLVNSQLYGFPGANIGAFNPADGLMYVMASDSANLYRINVATGEQTRSVAPLTMSQVHPAADWAFADGFFWSFSGVNIARWNLATGQVTSFPVSGSEGCGDSGSGAAWRFGNGNLGFLCNSTGRIFQIEVTNATAANPTFAVVASSLGPATRNNDAASSVGLPAELAITKTGTASYLPGDTVTYTLTVTNNGAGFSSGSTVNDTLPATLTNISSPTLGCSVTGQQLACNGPVLEAGQSYTVTVNATAVAGATGNIENTATVFGNEADANPANDTSTWVMAPSGDIVDLAESGSQGQPVTVPLTGQSGTIDPATVTFPTAGQPAGAVVAPDGKSMTVPGQGSWTVGADGSMTFAPEPGFFGNPTSVQYTATDAGGVNVEPATVTVTYPNIDDVVARGAEGTAVTLTPELTGIDPTSVRLIDPAGNPVQQLVVPGEGTWQVDPATGAVTFTPVPGLVGNPTPVQYVAADAEGNTATSASLNVLYPSVDDVSSVGAEGQPVTVPPALGPDAVATTVQFPTAGQPAGATVATDGRSMTVPNEGTWTIDPTTGAMTFTPDAGFLGDPSPVQYTAADADGNLAIPATVTVDYPSVDDVSGAGEQGQAVSIAPSLDAGTLATSVQFPTAGQPTGAVVAGDGKSMVVPGEGTWVINPTAGVMTFAPEAGFQGDPTPVVYTATDAGGNLAVPATVTVDYPNVDDVSGAGAEGAPVTVPPALDPGMDPATVQFIDQAGNPVSTLTVPGEGVWAVDPATGAMTFTPDAGFQGDPTPVQYTARDADGNLAAPANVTVEYPDVSDVAGAGAQGQPVTVPPVLDDDAVPTTVRLLGPTGNLETTLGVPGEGTWSVDPTTGAMTFTPVAGFQGEPAPVQYTASDAAGNVAIPATVTVTYPNVSDVVGSGSEGQAVTVPPSMDAGMDSASVQLIGADGALVSELTVPGEGTWTVDPATGAMKFTPETTFAGDPTPVRYTARDGAGNLAEPATATVVYPDVDVVSGTGNQGAPVTLNPALEAGMDPTTVQLLAPDGSSVTELMVPGEGAWSVDPGTGVMTFTPEVGFQGDPTPVQYTASDAVGNVARPAFVTVTYPDVADVAGSGSQGEPVTVATQLDPGTDPTTLQLLDGNGNPVSTLTVPGEGVWTVDPATGAITFTPADGFQGDPTPVKYTAEDADGNVALAATVTVTYVDVADVTGAGAQGQPVMVPPVLDAAAVPSTVRLIAPDGSLVTQVTVPGEGGWNVDPTTGAMTFTPEAGFQGDPTPVQYTAADASGNLAEPANVTVDYPDVSDVPGTGVQGQPVTVPPTIDEDAVASTVRFVDPLGNPVTELVVPGEGTWSVDQATGAMTFTPEAGFQGDPAPVRYTAADAAGNRSEPATVTVDYPDVSDVSGAGAQGQPVTVTPALDDDAVPSTVQLVAPDGSFVTQLTVPGEGVWNVDPATGAMTFTPEAGFQGDPTPVQYRAQDADGNLSEPATVTVSYSDVDDVSGTGSQGQPVSVTPALDGDADPTTVRLVDGGGNPVTELVVPGEGTWTVDPNTGVMTFTPEVGFQGDPTPVQYAATDPNGNVSEPATVTVRYPNVADTVGTGVQGEPVAVPPVLDAQSDPTTVRLVTSDGTEVTELTVPGEGVWTVDPNTGVMTFTPDEGFQGDPTPVRYTARDTDGNVAEPATATVNYPDVTDVTGSGTQGQPVLVAPGLDDDTDPATVRLIDGDGNPVTTLPVPDEGTWTVDPSTGVMTFTPEANFSGDPTPVRYTATDGAGNAATPATVTVTYPDVSDVFEVGAEGQPVTVAPALEAGMPPSTVQFPADGQPTGSQVSTDGKTLTVPGQGVWTIDPETGAMTFTPETGYVGDPTPVQYTAADTAGNLASPANVEVTYAGADPVANTGSTGQPVTVSPALEPGLDPATVAIIDPATGARVTTLTVPGEGTWTTDPVTGAMTFTPAAGFLGDPTPVQYTAATTGTESFATPVTATVTYLGASDVSGNGATGSPVTVPVSLEPGLDPTTVQLINPATGERVSELAVPGEGTWTIDPATGAMTFTPVEGFTADPTPVRYTAAMPGSNEFAVPATATVTYQSVGDTVTTVPTGTTVTVPPVLEEGLDPATVVLLDPNGNPVKSLVVPGEGTWTVDPDGNITFTPEGGFTNDPTPVQYTAADPDGDLADPARVVITYAGVDPIVQRGNQGQPVTVVPDLDPGLDPATVALVDGDGNRVSTLVVPDEGTWNVNPDGTVSFTPAEGFQGDPTPVRYTASNTNGDFATPATITVRYPDVVNVPGNGTPGQPVTLTPAFEQDIVPEAVRLLDPDGNPVQQLTVPGEGRWLVNPDGSVTFTPEDGFVNSPTPVRYTGSDVNGNVATPATLSVTYPEVEPLTENGAPGEPTAVVPTLREGMDPTTVVLIDPETGQRVTTLEVPGEGTWTVDPRTGTMTFTPEDGFLGDPTPVLYTARDNTGVEAVPQLVTVNYPQVSPTSATGTQGEPVSQPPVLDEGMDPTTVAFIDPATGERVSSVTVPGEGVWTIDPETGVMTFTPESGFQGSPTPVLYTAADPDGNFATPAEVAVSYPDVSDVSANSPAGVPVTVPLVLGPTIDPTTVRLVDGNGNRVTELWVPGEGTWTIDPQTGTATFTPLPNFTGSPTPVLYSGQDSDGNWATPATITVTTLAVPPVPGAPAAPGTPRLPVTGGQLVPGLAIVALLTLLAGAVLLAGRRKDSLN